MKKFVGFFTLILLGVFSILSAVNHVPKSELKKKELISIEPTNSDAFSAELDDTAFDRGSHGYGWYSAGNQKLGFDVESGNIGTIFRKKHDDGSGTMGGISGVWGDLESIYLYPGNQALGGRYPSTSTFNGYHFGVFGRASTDAASSLTQSRVLIFSVEDEEWTDAFQIISPDGVKPSGVWSPRISPTYNEATGEYVLAVTMDINGNNASESRTTSIAIGKSTTPMDTASWTWSDCTDLEFSAGGNVVEAGRIKVAWGKEDKGFGCGVTIQKVDATVEDAQLSWIRTDDFGENWDLNNDTFYPVNTESLFPWFGTTYTIEGGEPEVINDSQLYTTLDVVAANNDEIHVLLLITGMTDTYRVKVNDDGMPVSGYYDVIGTKDGSGGMNWEANFIAHQVGWLDETGIDPMFEPRYANWVYLSIGTTTNGCIVASWLDRPITDPTPAPEDGPGGLTDTPANFIDDAYVSYSGDNGRTWDVDEEGRPFNVTNTPDVHEEGWTITKNVKSIDGTSKELYAAHQYADWAPGNITGTPMHAAFEQNYHVWKISLTEVGIEAENLTLAKEFNLSQNYPNPFNPTTSINFVLKNSGKVNLSVFNTKGEVVSVLANEQMNAGSQSFTFDASNFNSGVYFYQLSVNGITESKKMVLTK